jgi:diaminopimelate epimerase
MRFVKMHGLGNDYVYVNGFSQPLPDDGATLADLARRVADRHLGVGGDGLILVLPPTPGSGAHVRMRMFNADGSESEMCGNGVRCVCKFAFDHGLTRAMPMLVETGRGVLSLAYELDPAGCVAQVTVDMGRPILAPADVPIDAGKLTATDRPQTFGIPDGPADDALIATFVSMGNPHAVIYVDDVQRVALAQVGPILEHHAAFPRRMNVHFVQVQARGELIMRTWERGSGITMACGTGACAVCVAGVLTGRTDRKLLAHLPGGDLSLQWPGPDAGVLMTGPATQVFTGDWPNDG